MFGRSREDAREETSGPTVVVPVFGRSEAVVCGEFWSPCSQPNGSRTSSMCCGVEELMCTGLHPYTKAGGHNLCGSRECPGEC